MADDRDRKLLDALAVAIAPPQGEPTMAELAALRAVVADAASGARSRRVHRWRRRIAVAVAGSVVLSSSAAYATSGAAPRPVRSAAFALKLPVEAPDLTDAKDALTDLDEELRSGRRDKVASALEDAEEELGDVAPSARGGLEP